jgi:hypothetical protein
MTLSVFSSFVLLSQLSLPIVSDCNTVTRTIEVEAAKPDRSIGFIWPEAKITIKIIFKI